MIEKGKDGLVWNADTSNSYLEDPKAFVPKNKMAFPGLKKPEERADVIAYLETASQSDVTAVAAHSSLAISS